MAKDQQYMGPNGMPPQAPRQTAGAQRMQRAPYGHPAFAGGPQGAPAQGGMPDKNGKGNKGKRPASFWVAVVIAVVAIIAVVVLAVAMLMPQQPTSNRDPNQEIGQLDGKTKEEIQAELDRVVQEGMFNISIAAQAVFADGESEGEIKIENVPGNRYLMQVDIVRDDNGEVIYHSGIIEPNHHLQFIKLDKDLDAGAYGCTATFTALDQETEEEVGKAAAQMTVIVQN